MLIVVLAAALSAPPEGAVTADWDGLAIPAAPPEGLEWRLNSVSDDFRYVAQPMDKPAEFRGRWKDAFINPWRGPGGTDFDPGHSYVTNGHLGIAASRKAGTDKVRAGVISSKAMFTYPLFIEARAKLNGQVLASNVWMLSDDSTEEIDILEAYGSQRPSESWTAHRLHLSHHVFIREPFQDYQPTDDGSWYWNGTNWGLDFHRIGVCWRDPWTLEYYVDGQLVRTVAGEEVIDPQGFTGGKGLTKPMHIIINTEDQDWRTEQGLTPTDEELADVDKSIMWVDWVRVYEGVRGSRNTTP